MIYAGIDVGSITTKAAFIKENKLLGTHVIPTGYNPAIAGTKVFEKLLQKSRVLKTGNNRDHLPWSRRLFYKS